MNNFEINRYKNENISVLDFYQQNELGPTIANNINMNICNIIEDVKKQRKDIIKLNNELKNSRNVLDKNNFEDTSNRQELSSMFRQLKKEKECLQFEISNLQNMLKFHEKKLREKEETIDDLRFKLQNYQTNLNEKITELENVKFKNQRLMMKLKEAETNNQLNRKTQTVLDTMEQSVQGYVSKYLEENQKNLFLTKQIKDLESNLQIMVLENTNLKQQIQNQSFLSTKRHKFNESSLEQPFKQELIYDYHVLNSLRSNLDVVIQQITDQQIFNLI